MDGFSLDEAKARAREVADNDLSLPDFSPDICVEVQSVLDGRSFSASPPPEAGLKAPPGPKVPGRLVQKAAAYFGVGVREVWVCDGQGKMRFYGPQGDLGVQPLERSALCPEFPDEVPAEFLR